MTKVTAEGNIMTQDIAVIRQPLKPASIRTVIILTVLSLILWDSPYFQWLLFPVKTFVIALHEFSHAITCMATGGTVSGMTIVSDNAGHGGGTNCSGGNPFIYIQAGYVGTAIWGCLLIMATRVPSLAKTALCLMGLFMAGSSITMMASGFFHGMNVFQTLGSMVWAIVIGAGLIFAGLKLKPGLANTVLLFLGIQTALNALTSVWSLIQMSFVPGAALQDSNAMENLTNVPAPFWSVLWGVIALVFVALTVCWTYAPAVVKKSK
jgi:hypothetical protein